LNLSYDITTRVTTVYLKSYQDIQPTGGPGKIVPSGHTFGVKITVLGISGISEQAMSWVGTPTLAWKYEYSDTDLFGIFSDPIQIEITGYETDDESVPTTIKRFTCRTSEFRQLQDISDLLKLLRYTSSGNDYLVNIPVMYYDIYDSDEDYYLEKMYNFMISMNFTENRMITDNIQCRFLNSYLIESPFTEAIFVQGKEIISTYTWLDDVLDILDDAPVSFLVGDRYLVSTSASGTFVGQENKIAEVVAGPTWSFITPEVDDGIYDITSAISYIWTGSAWITMPSIILPLKMFVTIKIDKTYVESNSIDLGTEKDNLTLALADYLQKVKSGTNVVFYNSQVIDFIHTERLWVKSVTIDITDSSSLPNHLNSGLEIKSDEDVLTALSTKLNIVKYTPSYIYWDVDNLSITLIV